MYYRKALELQAFLDMAKDDGNSLLHAGIFEEVQIFCNASTSVM